MKEYLFTEMISTQFRCFMTMFLLGCGIFGMYMIIRKYIISGIASKILKAFLELNFFLISALLTGGVVDYCCDSVFEPYMALALILGLPISYLIIGK